jgi:hypothetical protein
VSLDGYSLYLSILFFWLSEQTCAFDLRLIDIPISELPEVVSYAVAFLRQGCRFLLLFEELLLASFDAGVLSVAGPSHPLHSWFKESADKLRLAYKIVFETGLEP